MKSIDSRDNSAGSPMLVVSIGLICLIAAMSFTTLGLGLVNIAGGSGPPAKLPGHPEPTPASQPRAPAAEPAKKSAAKPAEQGNESEIVTAKLQEEARELDLQKRKLALDRATLLKSQNTLASIEKQIQDGVRQASEKAATVKGQAEQQRGSGSANVEARLADDLLQIAEADRKADELRGEIRDKKTLFDPDRLFAARDPAEKPLWVECVKGAVVLLPRGEKIALEGLKTAPAFAQAVSGRYVVFLVRPDGFGAFASARAAAEENGAKRLGYEPIDRNWQLKSR